MITTGCSAFAVIRAADVEAVDVGELHVEQHDLGPQPADLGHRRRPVGRLTDHVEALATRARMRALARNDGWSSTIRTVWPIARNRLWPQGNRPPIRLAALSYVPRFRDARGTPALGSLAPNTAEPATNTVAPAAAHGAGRARVDPRRPPRSPAARRPARAGGSTLSERSGQELLAAPARVHGHAEHEVDVVDELAHDGGRRARVQREPGAAARVADGAERVVGVRRGLEVQRDAVRARLGERRRSGARAARSSGGRRRSRRRRGSGRPARIRRPGPSTAAARSGRP